MTKKLYNVLYYIEVIFLYCERTNETKKSLILIKYRVINFLKIGNKENNNKYKQDENLRNTIIVYSILDSLAGT